MTKPHEEVVERIWGEPLSESERAITQDLIDQNPSDDLAHWLQLLLLIHDANMERMERELEACRGERKGLLFRLRHLRSSTP